MKSKSNSYHLVFVTWAQVVCLICAALELRVYISGGPQVPMLQMLCNTFTHISIVVFS